MRSRAFPFFSLLGIGLLASLLPAQEVRYETDAQGNRYAVTRRIVRQPYTDVQMREEQQTVYAEQYSTEILESQQVVYTPVTEYAWEPRVHNWWNPLAPAYVAYHLRPHTRWEARVQTTQTPIVRRELVPEQRTVKRPVRELGFVEKEVEQRIAIDPSVTRQVVTTTRTVAPASTVRANGLPAAQPLEGSRYGGVAVYEGDLPRMGMTDRGSVRR